MDVVMLSRIQFGLTTAFHIIIPTLIIGLALYLVATIAQGVTLGAYIFGIHVKDGFFAGGAFDWLQPFSLIAGYVLLGATYLIIKTTGQIQDRAFKYAFRAAWAVAGFMVLVSIWTPFQTPDIVARWLSPSRINFVWIFPVMGLLAFGLLLRSLKKRHELQPFIFSLLFFISAYLALQAGIFPYAILPDVTLEQAASQRETMLFTLVGAAVVLPVVLAYTIYSYRVFRGKVTADGAGYH